MTTRTRISFKTDEYRHDGIGQFRELQHRVVTHSCTVEITIDLERINRTIARKAVTNRSGKSRLGPISAKRIGEHYVDTTEWAKH